MPGTRYMQYSFFEAYQDHFTFPAQPTGGFILSDLLLSGQAVTKRGGVPSLLPSGACYVYYTYFSSFLSRIYRDYSKFPSLRSLRVTSIELWVLYTLLLLSCTRYARVDRSPRTFSRTLFSENSIKLPSIHCDVACKRFRIKSRRHSR